MRRENIFYYSRMSSLTFKSKYGEITVSVHECLHSMFRLQRSFLVCFIILKLSFCFRFAKISWAKTGQYMVSCEGVSKTFLIYFGYYNSMYLSFCYLDNFQSDKLNRQLIDKSESTLVRCNQSLAPLIGTYC